MENVNNSESQSPPDPGGLRSNDQIESFTDSFVDYKDAWLAMQDIDEDELSSFADEEIFLSVDLEEATYRIPFDILDENIKLCDRVMADFKPWLVYRDLFATHERVVDMTELVKKGYWHGPSEVTSTRGSFMGDGMSFIHLTLMLASLTSWAFRKSKRPLGQSVGDDLFLLKARFNDALRLCWLAETIGCKFSKLNSLSEDSLTFCENYCVVCSDYDDIKDVKSFSDSCFGDLLFLDIIKGSALAGQAKVKVEGADPFIGHATLLSKQVKWHPLASVKAKAKAFLWSKNYSAAIKLQSTMASLPQSLGGADIAVGISIGYHDDIFQEHMLPWYEAMLRLPERDFLRYYLLLRGIYQSSPKGYGWLNDYETISAVTKDCVLINANPLDNVLPDWMHKKTAREKLSFISKELNLISFHELAGQLARQEAFLRMWNLETQESFMTFLVKDAKTRTRKVWARIKSDLDPIDKCQFTSRSMNQLESSFQARTWGLFVNKDDPTILKVFQGMPSLFFDV